MGDQAYLYIKNGIIDQLLFQWERNHFITVKVLNLLHSMLNFNQSERFLVDDVIEHPWLSLYYHKYKHQMLKKSQLQQQKNKRRNVRLSINYCVIIIIFFDLYMKQCLDVLFFHLLFS